MFKPPFLSLLALGLLIPWFASAQLPPARPPAPDCDAAQLSTFKGSFDCVRDTIRVRANVADVEPQDVILSILRTVLTLTAIVGTVAAIIAGVMYMLSAGDEGKAEKAKHALVYLVIGLVIIGASILVVNLIINILRGTP